MDSIRDFGICAIVSQDCTSLPAARVNNSGLQSTVTHHAHAFPASPALDPEVIQELRSVGDGDVLLQRVLKLFDEHVPRTMSTIRQLAQTGTQAELADTVHGLKSMCGNIGARQATAVCQRFEQAARKGENYDVTDEVAKLAQAIDAVLAEVQRLRAS